MLRVELERLAVRRDRTRAIRVRSAVATERVVLELEAEHVVGVSIRVRGHTVARGAACGQSHAALPVGLRELIVVQRLLGMERDQAPTLGDRLAMVALVEQQL